MGAYVFSINGDAADPVAWNSGGHGVDAVGGAGLHLGDDVTAGPYLIRQFLQRFEHVRGAAGEAEELFYPAPARVPDRLPGLHWTEIRESPKMRIRSCPTFFGGVTGQDAAVHISLRRLRQGVVGMAAA